jgi:hypothetical protein
MELNHRPHAYQACALTELSYRPPVISDCAACDEPVIGPAASIVDFGFTSIFYSKIQFQKIQNPNEPIQIC